MINETILAIIIAFASARFCARLSYRFCIS